MPDRLRPFTALSTDASGTTSASGFRYVRDVVILVFFFYTVVQNGKINLCLFRNGASEMHICYLAGPSGLSIFFSLIDDSFQTIKLNTGIKIL